MFVCHDVGMNCLHINVRRLLDFVDVFGNMATTSNIDRTREDKGKIIITELGTAIQANMDVKDADYFNQLLQNHKVYRISGFSCEQTCHWERTLQNPTSLIFGSKSKCKKCNWLMRTLSPSGVVALDSATYNCPCPKTGSGRLEKKLPPVLHVPIRHYLIEIVLTGDRSKGKHFLANDSMQVAISIEGNNDKNRT
nr:nucleic acid-binding, OB-fold protein [Tanacetum cinerariifolium]